MQSVPQHRPSWLSQGRKERDAAYARVRSKADKRFYGLDAWIKLRDIKLNRDPYCEMCLKEDRHSPATLVHHVKEVKEHPELALDDSNLMSLCKHCHSVVHASKD